MAKAMTAADGGGTALLRRILTTPAPTLARVVVDRLGRGGRSLQARLDPWLFRLEALSGWAGERRLQDGIRFFAVTALRRHPERLRGAGSALPGARRQAVLEAAGEALRHRFDLLGSGPVELGARIDWQRDFKSGYRWPEVDFHRIRKIDLSRQADIKVPWELSRFHHSVTLGQAYLLSGEERYPAEFIREFHDWMAVNRPYRGVNWRSPMEAAIRAVNWIWAYHLMCDSPRLDKPFRRRFARALHQHGCYIVANLECTRKVIGGNLQRLNGNHYVADLVGLIYLGMTLAGRRAATHGRRALQELYREIETQVLPDGVQWELAPSYHRLVLEMVLSVLILLRDQGQEPPAAVAGRVQAMLRFLRACTRPDGLTPLTRDSDDGRLVRLDDCDCRDQRGLLAAGALFFRRADLLPPGDDREAAGLPAYAFWLFGPEAAVSYRRLLRQTRPASHSQAFERSGFYLLSDGDRLHVFVCCAGIGMNGWFGGHAHNDALSFELFWGDAPFLTDCGTYAYTGDPRWRNLFRSTAFHNTARVDGEEINRIPEGRLFALPEDAHPVVRRWSTSASRDLLVAEHDGYLRLPVPVLHGRSFDLDKEEKVLIIHDRFSGEGRHAVEVFFHFAPGLPVRRVTRRSFLVGDGKHTVSFSFRGAPGWQALLTDGWVSERYGVRRPCPRLALHAFLQGPGELTTRIECRGGRP